MNNDQVAVLQKLVNALQDCESRGITFSHTYLRLDIEDQASEYLESLSADNLSNLLNFVDGCGEVPSIQNTQPLKGETRANLQLGYDIAAPNSDLSCYIEIKGGVVQKWELF